MEQPPFQITSEILRAVAEIQGLLGEIRTLSIKKPSIKLRKENKIKTIHHSLAIEGNTLSEEQVTALLEKKRVLGPKRQILEVQNAIRLYNEIGSLNPWKEADLLKAHKILMRDLMEKPGTYRSQAVGIFKKGKISKMAPPAKRVPRLMSGLFSFLKEDLQTLGLIKACIFHYELELIHPFMDGNGRMGRIWQQVILMQISPIFEYLPVETMTHKQQKYYYQALEKSDVDGSSTAFIEFSLAIILSALQKFSDSIYVDKPKIADRIDFALEHFGSRQFSRKDYCALFKGLSTATVSRDLAQAVKKKKIKRMGTKALAVYICCDDGYR